MGQASDAVPSTSDPIMVIRPMVIPAPFLVGGPIIAGFLAIFPGFFTFVLSNMIAGSFEPRLGPGLVAFVLSFAVILGLIGLKLFYEPGQTTYAIYRDRIEFEEGLLNRQRRTVLLDKIIDMQLAEGVLQRTVGAGSISLVTEQLVSRGDGRLSNRSFQLGNVPDPGGVYDLIRSLALGDLGTKAVIPE